MARRFGTLLRVALALAFGFGLLAAAEGVLRLIGFGDLEVYDPDPEISWRLRPNQECYTKVGHQPVHISTQGYRSAPLPMAKPANAARVFIFGDSATYGWGVADEETYSHRLEQRLRGAGEALEVVNAGVNAYALFQTEIAFRRAIRFQPDGAIFAYSFNEAWQDLESLDADGRRRVLQAVAWKNYLRRSALYDVFGEVQMRFLYDRLRTQLTTDVHGGRAMDLDARLVRYRNTLERIEEATHAAGIPFAFLVLPVRGRSEPDPFQRTMIAFANERGIPVVDLTAPKLDPDTWFLPDDTVHPTPRGHEEIASHLEPVVQTLLAARRVSAPGVWPGFPLRCQHRSCARPMDTHSCRIIADAWERPEQQCEGRQHQLSSLASDTFTVRPSTAGRHRWLPVVLGLAATVTLLWLGRILC